MVNLKKAKPGDEFQQADGRVFVFDGERGTNGLSAYWELPFVAHSKEDPREQYSYTVTGRWWSRVRRSEHDLVRKAGSPAESSNARAARRIAKLCQLILDDLALCEDPRVTGRAPAENVVVSRSAMRSIRRALVSIQQQAKKVT